MKINNILEETFNNMARDSLWHLYDWYKSSKLNEINLVIIIFFLNTTNLYDLHQLVKCHNKFDVAFDTTNFQPNIRYLLPFAQFTTPKQAKTSKQKSNKLTKQ